ncbi:hypothetical protein F5B20DRAFT_539951 [Whalleya microplaca]|nr:hypothetical protein F5B20DRAFT_539951 [Whalleya microplaca]
MSSTQEPRSSSASLTESFPFLKGEDESLPEATGHLNIELPAYFTPRWWNTPLLRYAVFHGLAFCFYAVLFSLLVARHWDRLQRHDSVTYSPAQEAIAYENVPIDALIVNNKFSGYPNDESNAAWAQLLEGIHIKVTNEEMRRLGQTSLALKDGSGYIGLLGAYHELHCIKIVRKWIYKDYYYSNQTKDEYDIGSAHADHCLELLRQAAMCHGDITISTVRWFQDEHEPTARPTLKNGALHRCIRWDRLSHWAKARSVNLYDPNLISPEKEGID